MERLISEKGNENQHRKDKVNPPSTAKKTNVVNQWGQFDPKQLCFIFVVIIRTIRFSFMQDSGLAL